MKDNSTQKTAILHVLSSAEIAGGERYVSDLINNADSHFEHLVVLPYGGPFENILKNDGIEYKIVSLKCRFQVDAIPKLVNLVRKNRIEIIHTHGYRANFHGRIVGLLTGRKSIATIHVSLMDYFETPSILSFIYKFLEKFFSFQTRKYICVSKAMAADMISIGIPENKIQIIPNGVSLKRFHPRSTSMFFRSHFGILPEDPLIGSFGRMVPEKGQEYLIEAISILKREGTKVKCLFLGDGPLLPNLKKKAIEKKIQDLCIFGGIRNDVEQIYPSLDLFVLPSIREPFGIVLLEAMASSIPVIATKSGGPMELIESGKNGILVPSKDSRKLADSILFLIRNKEKAKEIARQGQNTINRNFCINRTIEETQSIYCSLKKK